MYLFTIYLHGSVAGGACMGAGGPCSLLVPDLMSQFNPGLCARCVASPPEHAECERRTKTHRLLFYVEGLGVGLAGLGLLGLPPVGPRLPLRTSWCLLPTLPLPHQPNSMRAEAMSTLFAIACPASTTVPGTYRTLSAYLLNAKYVPI